MSSFLTRACSRQLSILEGLTEKEEILATRITNQDVQRGRQLVESITYSEKRAVHDKRELGLLALKVDRTFGPIFREFRQAIGFRRSEDTLRTYAENAAFWPEKYWHPEIPFNVFSELRSRHKTLENAAERLRALIDEFGVENVTVDKARIADGLRPTRNQPGRSDEEALDRIEEIVKDNPDRAARILRAAAENPQFRIAARQALTDHDHSVPAPAKSTAPAWIDELGVHVELTKIARSLFRLSDELRSTRVEAEARDHYLEALSRIEATTAWMRNFLGGGAADWDEALQALMTE